MPERKRLVQPPETCPACGRVDSAVATWWVEWTLIDEAPAVGCRQCGYIAYLKERPYA